MCCDLCLFTLLSSLVRLMSVIVVQDHREHEDQNRDTEEGVVVYVGGIGGVLYGGDLTRASVIHERQERMRLVDHCVVCCVQR